MRSRFHAEFTEKSMRLGKEDNEGGGGVGVLEGTGVDVNGTWLILFSPSHNFLNGISKCWWWVQAGVESIFQNRKFSTQNHKKDVKAHVATAGGGQGL